MASHQVMCVNRALSADGTHHHISMLGLGASAGWRKITVAEAVMQLRSPYGDRYYTVSPSTGRRAGVEEASCARCGYAPHVRTTADGIADNNLSNLSECV